VLAVMSALLSVYFFFTYSVIHNSVTTVSGDIPMSVGNTRLELIFIALGILSVVGISVFSTLFGRFIDTKSNASKE